MDDTNTAGIGQKWLQQTQAMWDTLEVMGLRIAKHQCVTVAYHGSSHCGASAAELIHAAIALHGLDVTVTIAGEAMPAAAVEFAVRGAMASMFASTTVSTARVIRSQTGPEARDPSTFDA